MAVTQTPSDMNEGMRAINLIAFASCNGFSKSLNGSHHLVSPLLCTSQARSLDSNNNVKSLRLCAVCLVVMVKRECEFVGVRARPLPVATIK